MNNRRTLLIALGVTALASRAAFARSKPLPGKPRRVGFLGMASAAASASRVEALRAGLRELGYVEGRNVAIEYRYADGNYELLAQLAADLVKLNVEVIVTHGTPGTRAVKQATSTIPIVMAASGDAVVSGLVASLARPGGNVTGSTFFSPELNVKRLEVFKETLPGLRQVAVLVNPDNPLAAAHPRGMTPVSRSMKLGLHSFEARSPAEFESAFSAMAAKHVDGVVVTEDLILVANSRTLADLALKMRLPLIGGAEFAGTSGLIAFGANIPAMFGRAATFVDKILKGAKPAQLPVEQATRFDFVVNLKTAKALGISIPQGVLLRADRVIE